MRNFFSAQLALIWQVDPKSSLDVKQKGGEGCENAVWGWNEAGIYLRRSGLGHWC